ncbi:MAG: orotate phosphoribosyltransferase [Bacteroidetes bacterium]|nr:orotate phosphoribosyltransferase [Bacteroidota bacterium]
MIYDEDTALTTAEFLLQIKAVKLSPENPFTWASGLKSPIYCDNRKTLSYPRVRTFIRQEFVKIIQEEFISVDVIAGVATGGIAHGALVAQELDLPFVYVRTTQKSHGLENRIEGVLEPDSNVVVVEDLVSTGKSSLNAVKTLRDAGNNVKGMVAIFSYNLNIAEENFTKERCKLFTLADYNTLIIKAKEHNYVMDEDMMSLLKWRKNPEEWGK